MKLEYHAMSLIILQAIHNAKRQDSILLCTKVLIIHKGEFLLESEHLAYEYIGAIFSRQGILQQHVLLYVNLNWHLSYSRLTIMSVVEL